MPKHFNGLDPAEAERLALLAEEMGEAIQVIGKILRHGYESTHPNGGPTNRQMLERELGDVDAAIEMMIVARDVCAGTITRALRAKLGRLGQYLHHNTPPSVDQFHGLGPGAADSPAGFEGKP